MRVAIVDPDAETGQQLASTVTSLMPAADVVVYRNAEEGLAGIEGARPDVAFLAAQIGDVDGPTFLTTALALNGDPKYVGVVDAPDAEWSSRWIAAGAKLVVSRPADSVDVRTALRRVGGGIQP